MTLPGMESTNTLSRIMRIVDQLVLDFDAFRSASGTLDSATIYKGGLAVADLDTGARLRLVNGEIDFWSDFAGNPNRFGRIGTDPGNDDNFMRIYAPYTAGNGLQNTLTIQGTQVGESGNFFVFTDGLLSLQAEGRVYAKGTTGIDLVTGGSLRIYELPTTGSAANLRLDPGTVSIQYVTSSERYKDDIADAVIEPREVLQLQPRTWLDKGTIDRAEEGDEIPRNIGFIAEELDEIPSMRQFVDYTEIDGELVPDAIQYERIPAAQQVVLIDHEERIVQLEAAVAARDAQLENLTTRLEALEAAT